MDLLTVIALGTALSFAFINGLHDGGNVFATVIASRSLNIRKVIVTAFLVELIFPVFMGTAVAMTVFRGIIPIEAFSSASQEISTLIIIAAMSGALIWNLFTWKIKLPSSSSHALIGGLIGSGAASFGFNAILWETVLLKVILIMFLAPLIGFVVGMILHKLLFFLMKNASSKANGVIKKIQYLTVILMAASHGTSDSQKSMGVIALLLYINGSSGLDGVPLWVRFSCTSCLALGLLLGSWKIAKTVGNKIFKIKPVDSMVAQFAASGTIYASSALGAPVSTSQIVSSTVMGVGYSKRYKGVNWMIVNDIVCSWLFTIPAAGLVAAVLFLLIKLFF